MSKDTTVHIDSDTILFGVMGDPIRHSKSPHMHNRALRAKGVNGVYTALHIKPEALRDAIAGVRAMGFRGVNVTIPHKVNVMPLLDEIDEDARLIGAVNTIVNDNGKLTGYNTDGIGYVRSLKEEAEPNIAGKRILVIGAGGAARGIVYALAKEKPDGIWIANRTAEKARELAADFQAFGPLAGIGMDDIGSLHGEIDIVINTTSVGMHPHVDAISLDPDWLRPDMTVSDLIYNPLRTKLLNEAERRGCRIHGGLGMFIYQGAYAFEYWTGLPAPIETMRGALLE